MTFLVYILKSLNTGKLYIGQCSDMDDRFRRHNQGMVPSTRSGVPWEIIHTETYPIRGEAMVREKYLKSLKSSKYILENIINFKD